MWTNENTIKLTINTNLIDNRLYVSLRPLAEAVGANVVYKKADHTIHVITPDQHAIFWPGSSIMSLNGERKEIGSPIGSRNQQTQVPLRFITELLGWHVDWEDNILILSQVEKKQ
ncbi:hypothetical protein Back11_27760 [Paenibacillus baekrokdamisoli]|uniref:Copper amine oxidase-like N-terminal domain-containing protein n=1 Tax=Paenibacillus baekrokdamisoli TaxID=1712516 RepID=A0A3G9J6N6_9BACL|nr:copper amine oxidase N-terminal domain-containing protein [Paenibacillus baekrokdamisoli]MBB3071014.1 hypothetical protein [Paenibacillus baekrokdamisoli]BBH21431.1 hypothetical protein Back11_27760 [Paenibacillus baekrokdamisoli]